MEITQISYMHYYHTDGLLDGTQNNNTRKTPHYLLFLAIEHLKRSEYDLSIEYLNKLFNIFPIFIDTYQSATFSHARLIEFSYFFLI